ncbi:TerB family tellurite resistance protein [Fluviicola sp.]|uniref:TerB family tellurite resistance protein n=1 Tax=Fluviicola sp. TaxID=1917219 RepID=UPI002619DBE6|nr:TerB family tellurite resistance protein [Fluviicola sp.]
MNFFVLLDISSAQAQRLAEEEFEREKLIETVTGLSLTALIMAYPTYLLIRYAYFKLKKEFRFKTKFNPYNHIDALVLLSMNVLRTHPECFKEKCAYLKGYIVYLYPENNRSFHESLKMAYNDVYRSESIVHWLNRFQSEDERKDVVRFLIHMAAEDGVVGPREKAELVRIIDAFGLAREEWINLMENINRAFTKRQERWKKTHDTGTESYLSAFIDKSLDYFELKRESLNEDVLRTKYKRLVKKYHPDRHPGATPEERKELEVKFQELQSYYDELLKLVS